MNLEWSGRESIAAPKATVWAFVNDPQSVAHCMPDLLEYKPGDAHNFQATVRVAVGPVRGKFIFKIELQPQSDGERLNMKISGGGLGSVVDLTATSDIAATSAGETALAWKATATMRGPVAAIGGRVIDQQANRIVSETFANVKKSLSGAPA